MAQLDEPTPKVAAMVLAYRACRSAKDVAAQFGVSPFRVTNADLMWRDWDPGRKEIVPPRKCLRCRGIFHPAHRKQFLCIGRECKDAGAGVSNQYA